MITPKLTDKWTIINSLMIGILIINSSQSSLSLGGIFHGLITPV